MQDETLKSLIDNFSFTRILAVLIFFAATWLMVRILRFAAELLAGKFSRYRLWISSAFPVLRLLIWISALAIIILVIINPPVNTLLTIIASAGLAIGLGAQDLIRNVIAGILILMDRPFRVGDMVKVGEHYGEVTNIGLRAITLHTFDDSAVTIPNALVLGQAVANSNSGALDEMVVVEFRLPATLDVVLLRELAREAAACSPYVYLKKPIIITIEDEFQRTFLTHLKIKAYVLDIRLERQLASDISERFKQELIRHGLMTEAMVLGPLQGSLAAS
ncbi:mechanosensitive ion channel [Desulfuromonas carbonis]|uniref:mechanosensitive ion channel family protein n=1 Tax=Desulfuromonas sp. DDH964 TaxID=1823759 RepID=UPI00078CA58F|nr:mechanosensitive ion channel domain-containing protein [Desulfuromonas sp. DDH964]AMV73332.1 small-conductance mechanosensitive ion channel [Desulfuromonas sp. DDH964]